LSSALNAGSLRPLIERAGEVLARDLTQEDGRPRARRGEAGDESDGESTAGERAVHVTH